MIKKKIVILSGAGISAESGIETFRGSGGLWNGHPVMEVASIDGWHKDKKKVLDFYNERRSKMSSVEPNDAHKIIAQLENDFEVVVVTQNVDDLHEKAGSTNVIHLHGELTKMCSSLDKTKTLPYENDINIGDKHSDGSQLRPFIVWFGEDVPLINDAISVISNADYLIIVGTSLQVYPASTLMLYAKASCGLFYVDPNPNDDYQLQYFTLIKDVATKGMERVRKIINEENCLNLC